MEYLLAPLLLSFYGLQILFVIFRNQEAEEEQNNHASSRLQTMLSMVEHVEWRRRKERERFDWRKEGF